MFLSASAASTFIFLGFKLYTRVRDILAAAKRVNDLELAATQPAKEQTSNGGPARKIPIRFGVNKTQLLTA